MARVLGEAPVLAAPAVPSFLAATIARGEGWITAGLSSAHSIILLRPPDRCPAHVPPCTQQLHLLSWHICASNPKCEVGVTAFSALMLNWTVQQLPLHSTAMIPQLSFQGCRTST